MPEDRSLDEFAGADSTGDGDTDDAEAEHGKPLNGGGADDDDVESMDSPPEAVTPARSTATWTTDGATCTRCGTTVERRWVEDEALVCGSCMDW